MHKVEVGGAIKMESREFASPVPACFLKRLFVQSEVESRKFAEVSRVLHLAGTHFYFGTTVTLYAFQGKAITALSKDVIQLAWKAANDSQKFSPKHNRLFNWKAKHLKKSNSVLLCFICIFMRFQKQTIL